MISEQKALLELEKNLNQLVQTPMGRRAFLVSLPFLLNGCATSSKHRHREGDNSGQQTDITVQDEIRMTQEYLPQMRKEYPAVQNRQVQRYISSLGDRIVRANGLNKNPYQYNFTVVEAKHINAFALPAGTVFVTKPLIQMAETEAELAGVVGHEIGHIKARHTAERIDTAKKEQSKSILWGLGGALLGGAAGYGLGKLMCKKQDRECLKRAAIYGAAAGGAGGLLIQKFGFMANSREDEMEADRVGFRTSVNAGYHKDYVGAFYNKLQAMEEARKKGANILGSFADAMSTHPPSKNRVQQMHEMASSSRNVGTQINSKSFRTVKKLLG